MLRLHRMVAFEAEHCGSVDQARMNIARRLVEGRYGDGHPKRGQPLFTDIYRTLKLRELYEAFCSPGIGFDSGDLATALLAEATHISSAFELIASNIVQHEFRAASDITSHLIGEQLVRKVEADLPTEPGTGLQALEDGKEFAEGERVPDAKFKGQRSFQAPEPTYYGLSISLTQNMVKYDRMNLFLKQVGAVRDNVAIHREKRRLKALCDHADNQRYYPYDEQSQGWNKVSLWRTAITAGKWYARHKTSITNAIGNEAKLQAVMDNFNERKDEEDHIQSTLITQVLFPAAKQTAALKMLGFTNFQLGGSDSDHSKVSGSLTAAQILNGLPQPIFSKYLDSVSGAAGTWYIGNIREHLVERVVHDLTVERAPDSHAELFDRNLYGKWKAYYQANIQVEGDDNLLRCTP